MKGGGPWRDGETCAVCGYADAPHWSRGACGHCYIRIKNSIRRRARHTKTTRNTLGLDRLAVVREADGALAYIVTKFASRCEATILALLQRVVPLAPGQYLDAAPWNLVGPRAPQDDAERRGRTDYAAGKRADECPYRDAGNSAQYARRWRQGYEAARQAADGASPLRPAPAR